MRLRRTGLACIELAARAQLSYEAARDFETSRPQPAATATSRPAQPFLMPTYILPCSNRGGDSLLLAARGSPWESSRKKQELRKLSPPRARAPCAARGGKWLLSPRSSSWARGRMSTSSSAGSGPSAAPRHRAASKYPERKGCFAMRIAPPRARCRVVRAPAPPAPSRAAPRAARGPSSNRGERGDRRKRRRRTSRGQTTSTPSSATACPTSGGRRSWRGSTRFAPPARNSSPVSEKRFVRPPARLAAPPHQPRRGPSAGSARSRAAAAPPRKRKPQSQPS